MQRQPLLLDEVEVERRVVEAAEAVGDGEEDLQAGGLHQVGEGAGLVERDQEAARAFDQEDVGVAGRIHGRHHLGEGEGVEHEAGHLAPTPEGLTVTAVAQLTEVKGRKLVFAIVAQDGVEEVCRALHVRFVVDRPKFLAGVAAKAARVRG